MRLKEYDYSQPGAYFVSIVTQGRICRFGEVENGEMILNAAGKMAHEEWLALPKRFPTIALGAFVIMPNHSHGIIEINESVGSGLVPDRDGLIAMTVAQNDEISPILGDIIGAFKSITTVKYIRGVKNLGWDTFEKHLWQRNYYEHIIRDQKDWERIHSYIEANPVNWGSDDENPSKITTNP